MTRHFALAARAAVLGVAALTMAGCGGGGVNLREAVGVDKNPPDAFAVVRHGRDLEIPTSLGALPQPDADARSRMRPDSEQDAIRALRQEQESGAATGVLPAALPMTGGFVSTPAPYASTPQGLSSAPAPSVYASQYAPASSTSVTGGTGDGALLATMGAYAAPQDIRAVVDAEAVATQEQRVVYPLERVLPILRNMRGDALGDPLDPVEEYRQSGALPAE